MRCKQCGPNSVTYIQLTTDLPVHISRKYQTAMVLLIKSVAVLSMQQNYMHHMISTKEKTQLSKIGIPKFFGTKVCFICHTSSTQFLLFATLISHVSKSYP